MPVEDLLADAPDPACQFDRQLRYRYVNRAYEQWTGIPRSRLIGRTSDEAGVPQTRVEGCLQHVRRVLDSGSPRTYVEETQAASDQLSHFEWHLFAQKTESGQIDAVMAMGRDITAQKQNERELERAKSQLLSILDGISESFLALDREWRFTYVNQHVLEQTRKRREDLIGQNIWQLFPMLNETVFRTEMERVARERTVSHFQYSFRTNRCFEVHAYPFDDGVSAGAVDVTDRKRSERELGEAHEMFRAVVHASPLPIVYIRANGEVTMWNEAAERVFGWAEAEVIGKPLPFVPREKMDEHREMRARDLSGEGFTEREIVRCRKDGSSVEISVSTAAIRDPEGEIRGIVSVYQDITQRKAIERGLRESEQSLREREEALRIATESAEIGIWVYDVANDRLKMSPLAARLAGFEQNEVGVRQLLSNVHEDDRERVKQQINDALERSDDYVSEYRVVLPGGVVRWLFARGQAETTPDGANTRFSGVVTDITERKKVEDDLARHAQELARSNADLQQFAFVTSHDLQEPLRSIASYAQLLARRYEAALDDDAREYLGFIVDGASRMQQLINDLLAFSRILHGRERASVDVDMELVFAWTVMNLNQSIQESGALVSHDPLPSIRGNQQEIIQLMQNLLGNAIKYRGKEPPRIYVSAEERENEILFAVRDNGIGIAPEYHEQIFGVFKRLHGKSMPGTGIGLAIAKRIVEKHGGRIWVESREGTGATFCFTVKK